MSNDQVTAVRKMQQYIAEHLKEPITLLALARQAGYSPWYSARIFKTLTGKTPFEYIRLMRLSEAALFIRDKESRVLDVALDFVFDSQEGFTRAFSRTFGITPKRYMTEKPPISLFMAYPAVASYKAYLEGEIAVDKETSMIFTQVVEKPRRKMILKRGIKAEEYFAYCEEVGCDIWGTLTSIKEALGEPMGLWLPERMRPDGTSTYVQGVEVAEDYAGIVPEGYDLIDMPAAKIMVFQGEPYDDEIFIEAIAALRKAIEKYDPRIYGFKWKEDGIQFQLEPQGYRGYIEGKEVEAL